jgi:hypothetical protein
MDARVKPWVKSAHDESSIIAVGMSRVGIPEMRMRMHKKSNRGRRVASTANPSTTSSSTTSPAAPPAGPAPAEAGAAPDDWISESVLSLHQLFEQQTRQMLDRADLDEEQKQNILIAMSCPCCGAGAMSYTAKLKR